MFLHLWSFMSNVFSISNHKYCKLLDLIVGLAYFKDFFFLLIQVFFFYELTFCQWAQLIVHICGDTV